MKKLISWNVNGLRACLGKNFEAEFSALDADFFCLQETKLQMSSHWTVLFVDFCWPTGWEMNFSNFKKSVLSRTRFWMGMLFLICRNNRPFLATSRPGALPKPTPGTGIRVSNTRRTAQI